MFFTKRGCYFFTLSPITTLPGMILRFAASHLETERFIHYTTLVEEKEVYDNTFTHMQWNICGIKGGYDIEDGGQMPIKDDLLPSSEHRISKIIEKILNEDPDVLCLNEVFDIADSSRKCNKSAPVTYFDLKEAKYSITSAMSSGGPIFFISSFMNML